MLHRGVSGPVDCVAKTGNMVTKENGIMMMKEGKKEGRKNWLCLKYNGI